MPSNDVMQFWFDELSAADRWTLGPRLDRTIIDRFGETHRAAAAGELWTWRDSPNVRLAEIIVLDQFSRHICRNRPSVFANDSMALVLAQEAVRVGADLAVRANQRLFSTCRSCIANPGKSMPGPSSSFPGSMARWIMKNRTSTSSSASFAIPIAMRSWAGKARRRN